MQVKTIENWLEVNAPLFTRRPIVQESSASFLEIAFENTSPLLTTCIQVSGCFMVAVQDPNDCNNVWDFVADFDVSPRKTPSGSYYCNLCESYEECKYLALYSSELELWEAHSLTPWVEWMNAIINTPHEIRLGGSIEEGFTTAIVVEIEKSQKDDGFFHALYPVNV